MNTADSISFQSLHMIRDELVSTIEQSARDLEVYVASKDQSQGLNACIDGIRQILGILKLLEFEGAVLLTEELLATAKIIAASDSAQQVEKELELVSNTFFVISRYLEYILQVERKLPVLLVPYINELRKNRREPLLPESFFFEVSLTATPKVPSADSIVVRDSEFRALLIRLRHMYQLGLLGVLKNKQAVASLGLMRRALIRLQRVGSDKPLALLWWMANLVVDAFIQQEMELIEPRKMLLSRIDRIIRQVQKGGASAYQAMPPKGLIKELLYLLILSASNNPQVQQLKKTYKVKNFSFTERELAGERQSLRGPSVNTISSLVRVLQTETSSIKSVLETSAQGMQVIDDVDAFRLSLTKISDTLVMVGLVGAGSVLKAEVRNVGGWANSQKIPKDEMETLAKTLLYIDSSISSLETHTRQEISDMSDESQSALIANSELAKAERIVLTECEAGIQLTKRAITSYSESDFDPGHIANLSKILTSVRGGLLMLRRPRAAKVIGCCVEFVDEVLMNGTRYPALAELLETFADVIISVEYFFDTSSIPSRLDDSVLQVAEESLAALGLKVEP